MTDTDVSSGAAEPLWKILRAEEAARLLVEGAFAGSPDDRRDGFIHLSAAGQVAGTLAKHFAGAVGLVGARCDPDRLGEALRWEPSRGGALFPHLYRPLRLADVTLLLPCAETRLAGVGSAAEPVTMSRRGGMSSARHVDAPFRRRGGSGRSACG